MRVVLTNDDGIDAPGIAALAQATDAEIVTVAPLRPHSGCGHRATTHTDIEVHEHAPTRFAVDGTPVDCARLALTHLAGPVDWVFSGINWGGNLGADIYHSGTLAAAREAALMGVPALAVSHYVKSDIPLDWARAAEWARGAIERVLSIETPPGTYWNINLPHLPPGAPEPETVFCECCSHPLPVNFRRDGGIYRYTGVYAERLRTPHSDVDVCFGGAISITALRV